MKRLIDLARHDRAAGVTLTTATVVALAWANSSPSSYSRFWSGTTLHSFVNDGLMTLFFVLVGLEIRREMVAGELRTFRRASVPIAAAVGGMIVPALIYASFVRHGPEGHAWGVPMATDVAFALGALALIGSSLSLRWRTFLMTLAVADDLLAIAVLVVFYGRNSGVAAVTGVAIGLVLPFFARGPRTVERQLLPFVNAIVLPMFAVANAGIVLSGDIWSGRALRVLIAVLVARIVGKPLGITGVVWFTNRVRIADHNLRRVLGVGWVAAVGFTVPLLIVDAALPPGAIADAAKAGLIASSLVGVWMGYAVGLKGG